MIKYKINQFKFGSNNTSLLSYVSSDSNLLDYELLDYVLDYSGLLNYYSSDICWLDDSIGSWGKVPWYVWTSMRNIGSTLNAKRTASVMKGSNSVNLYVSMFSCGMAANLYLAMPCMSRSS